jgi:AcrR family transcriptional regulator
MSAAVIDYDRPMTRWEPGGRGRLAEAALALFSERGFEQTTVAEIAKRAGLTERTFFRHFADKREVLFAGGSELRDLMVDLVAAAPEATTPIAAVAEAVEAACARLQERQEFSRRRQSVIAANAELQERELIKLAGFASALADALRARGVKELPARLAAEVGIAVFRTAFERWHEENGPRDLPQLVRESFAELNALTAAR